MSTKVKSSFSKRFKLTASGRIKTRRANRSHILTKKKASRKMRLRGPSDVAGNDRASVLTMLLGKTRWKKPKVARTHEEASNATS